MLRQYADAIVRYRKGDVKYVKLLDGGLVDNYGLAGFTISRLLSQHAAWPAVGPRGRQAAPRDVPRRRRRPPAVRRMEQDGCGSLRRRPDHGDGRYRHRFERRAELHRVQRDDE